MSIEAARAGTVGRTAGVGIGGAKGGIATLASLSPGGDIGSLTPGIPMPEGGIAMTDTRSQLPNLAPLRVSALDGIISPDTSMSDETFSTLETIWSRQPVPSLFDKIIGPSKPFTLQSLPSEDRRMVNQPNAWSEIRFTQPAALSKTLPVETMHVPDVAKQEHEVQAVLGEADNVANALSETVQKPQISFAKAAAEVRAEFAIAQKVAAMEIDGVSSELLNEMAERAFTQSLKSKKLTSFTGLFAKGDEPIAAAETTNESIASAVHEAMVEPSVNQPVPTTDLGVGSIIDASQAQAVQREPRAGVLLSEDKAMRVSTQEQVMNDEESVAPAVQSQPDRMPQTEVKEKPEQDVTQEVVVDSPPDATPPDGELWVHDEETNQKRSDALQDATFRAQEKRIGMGFHEDTAYSEEDDAPEVKLDEIPTQLIVDELHDTDFDPQYKSQPLKQMETSEDESWTQTKDAISEMEAVRPEDAERRFEEIIDDKTAVMIVNFKEGKAATDEQVARVMNGTNLASSKRAA